MKLVIAGGGTAGHVHAGIAIAEEWKRRHGEESRIVFVGGKGGIEEAIVPSHGYPLYLLQVGSLNRVSWLKRSLTFLQLPLALIKSTWILLSERPSAVLGVGGYASGPFVLAAAGLRKLFGVRTSVLEQNSIPGMTNRILSKFVDRIFVLYEKSVENFGNRSHVFVSGNPIRSNLTPMKPASRKPFTVFIFGGSRGAVGVNSLVLEALPFLKERNDIRLIHQTGALDYQRVAEGYRAAGVAGRVERFITDMKSAYEESALVICRSGASTLAELGAVGRAAILIPLPTAADNHQEENARIYVNQGAARLLLQNRANGKALADLIVQHFEKPELIDEMEKKVRCFYRPNAAQEIVDKL